MKAEKSRFDGWMDDLRKREKSKMSTSLLVLPLECKCIYNALEVYIRPLITDTVKAVGLHE